MSFKTKDAIQAQITVGDVEIGAVEIKDKDLDNRANVIPVGEKSGLVVISVFSYVQFWSDIPLTSGFQAFTSAFTPLEFEIYNDSTTNYIEYSFNGTDVHGRLLPGEIKVEPLQKTSIYLRGQAGNEPYRLWARG